MTLQGAVGTPSGRVLLYFPPGLSKYHFNKALGPSFGISTRKYFRLVKLLLMILVIPYVI
jgi:hypothetical protein